MEAAARGTSTGCTSPDPGWTTRQTRGRRRKDGTDVCSRLVVAIVGQNKRDAWDLPRSGRHAWSFNVREDCRNGRCDDRPFRGRHATSRGRGLACSRCEASSRHAASPLSPSGIQN
ncbi:hypothetical protein FNF29_01988 [Cafeteria roenbergensis]|uniref:Uncharacterized protein n=1 Tax=Cafeteria roenbergensis TaxID=33653 RepID=A0A5A8CRS0_CAFRO|nr:hypothetical protein FNF29_01988 [Cafeteria roenbergensis]|eukprot:KAA0155237.1 hypothetical protein FNF29_01988 [Cafeteria roenbergensis]